MRNIVEELGIEGLTQEEKDRVMVQLTDSLLKRLVLRVYDNLMEKDQEAFDALTARGDAGAIDAFLKEKIPDLDEIKDNELDELVAEMKDFLAVAKK